uniref:Uncharacterized protein n=1 Tax=Arsenophonus endosymbiont of Trialeurodes vaporariorum TaxID=235567 RepID=A0A3B0MG15_9GAMM
MVTDGMSTLNFNTDNQTYKALLGNTVKFKVPSF